MSIAKIAQHPFKSSDGYSQLDVSNFCFAPNGDALLFGGGHFATSDADVGRLIDVANVWTRDYPVPSRAQVDASWGTPQLSADGWLSIPGFQLMPATVHSYTGNIWSRAIGKMLKLSNYAGGYSNSRFEYISQSIGEYDEAAKTWANTGLITPWLGYTAYCEDPVSLNIVHAYEEGYGSYDPRTRKVLRWTKTPLHNFLGVNECMAYYPPNDRFYIFRRGITPNYPKVVEATLDRSTWSMTFKPLDFVRPGSSTATNDGENSYHFDADSGLIIGGLDTGVVYGFHPEHGWLTHEAPGAGTMFGHHWAYDSEHNRHVVICLPGDTFEFHSEAAKWRLLNGGTLPTTPTQQQIDAAAAVLASAKAQFNGQIVPQWSTFAGIVNGGLPQLQTVGVNTSPLVSALNGVATAMTAGGLATKAVIDQVAAMVPSDPVLTPRIDSYTSNVTTVVAGSPVTFFWQTTDALSAIFDGESVPVDGSKTVTPTADRTYTFSIPGVPSRSISITVTQPQVPPTGTIDGRMPIASLSVQSNEHAWHGPIDWIKWDEAQAMIDATPEWDCYYDTVTKVIAPSQNGVKPTSWWKEHLFGNTPGLYGGLPAPLDGGISIIGPQGGDDILNGALPQLLKTKPRAGKRGRCVISPYVTWHGHTRRKADGTLGTPLAPLYFGIRIDGMVQDLGRDGSCNDVLMVPGAAGSTDFSYNPVPADDPLRRIMFIATGANSNGRILRVDLRGNPPVGTTSNYVAGLGKPTSCRMLPDGNLYIADWQAGAVLKATQGDAEFTAPGSVTKLIDLPGAFFVDYEEGTGPGGSNLIVVLTTNMRMYRIDPANPNLDNVVLLSSPSIPFGELNTNFWTIEVDRNGTVGPKNSAYAISTHHGTGNVDTFRVNPVASFGSHTVNIAAEGAGWRMTFTDGFDPLLAKLHVNMLLQVSGRKYLLTAVSGKTANNFFGYVDFTAFDGLPVTEGTALTVDLSGTVIDRNFIPSGGHMTVGPSNRCIDPVGHYMWGCFPHPDEALLLFNSFASYLPSLLRPARASDPLVDVYTDVGHLYAGRGFQVLCVGASSYDANVPSFTAQMDQYGWSLIGPTTDLIASWPFAEQEAFIARGMLGVFPRQLTRYDMFCVLYYLNANSQQFLKKGKAHIDALKAYFGGVPTPTTFPASPLPLNGGDWRFLDVRRNPITGRLRVEVWGKSAFYGSIEAGVQARIVINEGTTAKREVMTVPIMADFDAVPGTNGYQALQVGGTIACPPRATILTA